MDRGVYEKDKWHVEREKEGKCLLPSAIFTWASISLVRRDDRIALRWIYQTFSPKNIFEEFDRRTCGTLSRSALQHIVRKIEHGDFSWRVHQMRIESNYSSLRYGTLQEGSNDGSASLVTKASGKWHSTSGTRFRLKGSWSSLQNARFTFSSIRPNGHLYPHI